MGTFEVVITDTDPRWRVDVPQVGEIIEGTWLLAAGDYHEDGEPDDLPDIAADCLSSTGECAFVESIIETSTGPVRSLAGARAQREVSAGRRLPAGVVSGK